MNLLLKSCPSFPPKTPKTTRPTTSSLTTALSSSMFPSDTLTSSNQPLKPMLSLLFITLMLLSHAMSKYHSPPLPFVSLFSSPPYIYSRRHEHGKVNSEEMPSDFMAPVLEYSHAVDTENSAVNPALQQLIH